MINFPNAPLQWTGGTITPTGNAEVTNLASSSMTIVDGGGQIFPNILYNYGTITQTGTGQLNMTPGTVVNEAGAVYDLQGGSLRLSLLENEGLFEKTGSGTSEIGNEVKNLGTIDVQAGSVSFYPSTGTLDQFSSGTLTAGTWVVSGGASLSLPTGDTITSNQTTLTLVGSGSSITGLQLRPPIAAPSRSPTRAIYATAGARVTLA